MRWLAEYVMRGRMQAIAIACLCAMLSLVPLLVMLSIFSSGVVALVTLRRGATEGLIILASATAAAGLLSIFLSTNFYYVLIYGLVLWLPVWLISVVLREGRHLNLAIQLGIFLGVVLVIGYYGITEDPVTLWQQKLPDMLPNPPSAAQLQQAVTNLAPYMTGIAVAGGVVIMLLGLFMGRWWQAMLYNPGGFRNEFLSLRANQNWAIITLLTLILGIALPGKGSEIAYNVTTVLAIYYVFIGIAVLHQYLAQTNIAHMAVPMLYITIALVRPAILLVILAGVMDTWLDFRKLKSK